MIDSHAHLNDKLYLGKEKEYLLEAKANGVSLILNIGFDLESSINAVFAAKILKNEVYASIGIHPSDVKNMKEDDLEKLEALIDKQYVKAIGEIGLDFYWDKDEEIKNKQKEIFIRQIELANKHNLPVVIHSREAINETYQILKKHKVNKGGIMHCYPGSKEMMKDFIELGFLIGIGGVVTFKNAQKLKEVAKEVPLNSFVVETDAPYLAPTPHRGKLNHSKYLPLIVKEIATLKGIEEEIIIQNSDNNFIKKFLK